MEQVVDVLTHAATTPRLRYLESLLALAPSPQELLEFRICTAEPWTSHGHLMFAMFKASLVVTQTQVCWNKQKHTNVAVGVYDVVIVYHQPQTDGQDLSTCRHRPFFCVLY